MSETGLYYLQSRYYDPNVGRFINADDTLYLDAETINGLNLYAYCGNNPVNTTDTTGYGPLWDKIKKVAKAVAVVVAVTVVVAAVAVAVVATCGAAAPVIAGVAIGAAAGGLVFGGINLGTQIANNGIDNIDYGNLALSTAAGATIGAVVGGVATYIAPAAGSFLSSKFTIATFTKVAGGVMTKVAVQVTGAQIVGGIAAVGLLLFAKLSGKERSTDKPSWFDKGMDDPTKTPQEVAKNAAEKKYGTNDFTEKMWREIKKIIKYITRHIRR